MGNLRGIRNKIRSIRNIQQITKAMKMAAAARLRRSQGRMEAARPYADTLFTLMGTLAPAMADADHPLLTPRPEKCVGLVLVTGDKGLCGGYNSNLIRAAQQFLRTAALPVKLVTVGNKGAQFFSRRGTKPVRAFGSLPLRDGADYAADVARYLTGLYVSGEVDRIVVIYSRFVSKLTQRPEQLQLLPVAPPADAAGALSSDMLFEPDRAAMLQRLLPLYLETVVFNKLLESLTSEFASRMTAMTAATDNAGEIIDRLTMTYNRARQAAITTEIIEVTTGAEALRAGNDA